GEGLVFKLNHRGAGAFEIPYRTLNIQCVAESGVAVNDDMGVHAIGDLPQYCDRFSRRSKAYIRAAKARVGYCPTRQVNGLEPGLLRNQRRQGVVYARRQKCTAIL